MLTDHELREWCIPTFSKEMRTGTSAQTRYRTRGMQLSQSLETVGYVPRGGRHMSISVYKLYGLDIEDRHF